MKGIPRDVDQLMWALAEARDARAQLEFEERFPDLKYELAKRISLVRNLKGSRPGPQTGDPPPAFVPPRIHPPAGLNWRWSFAAALMVAALAFGSYAGYRAFRSAPKELEPEPGAVRIEGFRDAPIRRDDALSQPPIANPVPQPQGNLPEGSSTEPIVVSCSGEGVKLVDALDQIAKKAGILIEVAPGFPDKTISFKYASWSVDSILNDLSLRFGFSVFKQSDRHYLLIPAVEGEPGDSSVSAGGSEKRTDSSGASEGQDPPRGSRLAPELGR
ncbi:MAG: hypothetical protein EDM74_06820 [Armatimonadetes bacterium]|nr:MAG: hypothetical protein EDM74_06820 [Armatimonadota bacterium]